MKTLNSSGASLVYVLALSALLGVISLGVMKLMDHVNKSQQRMKGEDKIKWWVEDIQNSLSDPEICKETFKNKKTTSSNKSEVSLTKLGDSIDLNNTSKNVKGGVEIKEIYVAGDSLPKDESGNDILIEDANGSIKTSMILRVTFKKPSGGMTKQDFQIYASKDKVTNVITGCVFGVASQTAVMDLCMQSGGIYDLVHDSCSFEFNTSQYNDQAKVEAVKEVEAYGQAVGDIEVEVVGAKAKNGFPQTQGLIERADGWLKTLNDNPGMTLFGGGTP